MATPKQTIQITVLTVDGSTHVHEFNSTPGTEATLLQLLARVAQDISQSNGGTFILADPDVADTLIGEALPGVALPGRKPMVIYNTRHIVSVSMATVD